MTYSSHGSRTNTAHFQIFVNPKALASIFVVLLFLLNPRLWSESRKEYIHGDGGVVAVETGAAGCGPYTFSETPDSRNFGMAGGSGSITAHGGDGSACALTVSNNASSWISITGGGTGYGYVTYKIAANTGTARAGAITIAGTAFTINQEGCTYTIAPTSSGTISVSGGIGSFTLTTSNSACAWTISKPTWVAITSGSSGSGTGTVSYSAEANTGAARNGSITAGGKTYAVSQAGVTCQQACSNQLALCNTAVQPYAATCPSYCENMLLSQGIYPSNPNYNQMYSTCMSSCTAQVYAGCYNSYNTCVAGCP